MTTKGISSQGEGSGDRRSALTEGPDRTWSQTLIFPPAVVWVRLEVGYVAETRHVQLQLEVTDPMTKELLGMMSMPHRHAESPADALEVAVAGLTEMWLRLVDPPPFGYEAPGG